MCNHYSGLPTEHIIHTILLQQMVVNLLRVCSSDGYRLWEPFCTTRPANSQLDALYYQDWEGWLEHSGALQGADPAAGTSAECPLSLSSSPLPTVVGWSGLNQQTNFCQQCKQNLRMPLRGKKKSCGWSFKTDDDESCLHVCVSSVEEKEVGLVYNNLLGRLFYHLHVTYHDLTNVEYPERTLLLNFVFGIFPRSVFFVVAGSKCWHDTLAWSACAVGEKKKSLTSVLQII